MTESRHRITYVFFDIIAAILSWLSMGLFCSYLDSIVLHCSHFLPTQLDDFVLIFVAVFIWIVIYFIQGTYFDVLRKSRLQELAKTFIATIIGVICILLFLFFRNKIFFNRQIFELFIFYSFFHFVITYFFRIIITSYTINKIRAGKLFFNTILAGSNGKAINIFNEINAMPKYSGNKFVGFISVKKTPSKHLQSTLNYLGEINELDELIDKHNVKEIIIATEKIEYEQIGQIISIGSRKNVRMKIIPDLYDYLIGRVKLSHLYDIPLIEINQELIPRWQIQLKRLIDLLISAFALIVLSPLFLSVIIAIRLNSKGRVFYSHERIGRFGKPFRIYKFRSMVEDAEKEGPSLACVDDPRITTVGKYLRKTRLDEIPQFYNVLKGDMSLVGPRPERQYYIDEIVKEASHYYKLQRIRPGITSWGQVKFGYAENVEQMLERLKFDMVYLDNMSIYTDIKILIYTIYIVLKANGR